MNPHYMARLRIAFLMFWVILIQTTLGSDLRTFGVAPDFMILVVVCAGMAGGAEAGAWVGFWAGLTTDMFLTSTPVGLSALTYCLIGAATGALRANFLQERRLLMPAAAFLATAVGVVVFVGVGDVLGQSQLLGAGRSWLIRVALIESLWGALLSIPASYIYGWAARGSVGVDAVGGSLRGGAVNTERAVFK